VTEARGLDSLVPVVVQGERGATRTGRLLAWRRARRGDVMLCAEIFTLISGEKNRERNKKKPWRTMKIG